MGSANTPQPLPTEEEPGHDDGQRDDHAEEQGRVVRDFLHGLERGTRVLRLRLQLTTDEREHDGEQPKADAIVELHVGGSGLLHATQPTATDEEARHEDGEGDDNAEERGRGTEGGGDFRHVSFQYLTTCYVQDR